MPERADAYRLNLYAVGNQNAVGARRREGGRHTMPRSYGSSGGRTAERAVKFYSGVFG
jgi:hypothetical protein